MVVLRSEIANATRAELLEKIAEVCFNHEEPNDHDEWDRRDANGQPIYSDDDLRTVVVLTNQEEFFTLLQYPRITRNRGKGHCFLLERLYDFIRIRAITNNPVTGIPLTESQKARIINAMKTFFPDRMEEILAAERFVNRRVGDRRAIENGQMLVDSEDSDDTEEDRDGLNTDSEDEENDVLETSDPFPYALVDETVLLQQFQRLEELYPIPGPSSGYTRASEHMYAQNIDRFQEHIKEHIRQRQQQGDNTLINDLSVLYNILKERSQNFTFAADYVHAHQDVIYDFFLSLGDDRLLWRLNLNNTRAARRASVYYRRYLDILRRYSERYSAQHEALTYTEIRPQYLHALNQVLYFFDREFSFEESLLWYERFCVLEIHLEVLENSVKKYL